MSNSGDKKEGGKWEAEIKRWKVEISNDNRI